MLVQKLKIQETDIFLTAQKYYAILSAINSLKLTQRELELIAFTAIRGNISYKHFQKEFCNSYNTSSPTIYNMMSKLRKMKILIKDEDKGIKVNPLLQLDFNSPLILQININGQT